jgi:Pyridoxal-dependent decarboxylase conserved domain
LQHTARAWILTVFVDTWSVKSITVSGHKFGLVYPGVGWLVFRDDEQLPEDLVFYENYLGQRDATFTLNFSGSSSFILAQYYNFVRRSGGLRVADAGDGRQRQQPCLRARGGGRTRADRRRPAPAARDRPGVRGGAVHSQHGY